MILAPMKCRPCYKDYLWGGTKLKTGFGKTDAPARTAESWELSAHPDGLSLVEPLTGGAVTLDALSAEDRRAILGERCRKPSGFPLLVKLIDAADDLSVQVHPSVLTAHAAEGEQGKTEAWYILDCEPHACIWYGFSESMTRDAFLSAARDGTVCRYLNRIPISRGDVFLIPPGTIHAIGAGVTVAEIQQSSNTTFRIFDHFRADSSGQPRPLHLERAADVLDYRASIPDLFRCSCQTFFPGLTMTEVVSCGFFRLFRVQIAAEAELFCDGSSFQHLLCIEGEGAILWGGLCFPFRKGDSYFLPAALGVYMLRGACSILLTML